MNRAIFTIDGFIPAYIGYTDGRLWNGWATPYFEKAEALAVMADYNTNTETPMFYNEEYDTFYHFGNDSYDGAMWKGADYSTKDGIKHLYAIGAYCWVWDSVNDRDRRYIAQEVEEFIFYYEDEYDLKQEAIMEQLQDLDTFHKVICLMRDEDLSAEARFEALRKEITI